MADVRSILWRFMGDSKSLDRASGKATKSLGGVEKGFSGATKAAGALGLALGAREVAQFAGDAVQLAMSAAEVDSKFEAVFGSADELRTTLSELGDMAGITDQNIFNLAATFGNLAQAQGISAADTKTLTVDVGKLAADMASFNDSDPAVVFDDLNKALLTTEREGMKKYGISISELEVKQGALRIATADGREEVTKADRAMAAYEIAVQQAGNAIGDLERTQDSSANMQRQLKATIEELQTEIGKELLPAYKNMMQSVKDLMPIIKAGTGLIGDMADGVTNLSAVVGAVTDPVDAMTRAVDMSRTSFFEAAGNLYRTYNPQMWAAYAVLGAVKGEVVTLSNYLDSGYKPSMTTTTAATEDLVFATYGVSDAYIGFAKQIRDGRDAAREAAGAVDDLTEANEGLAGGIPAVISTLQEEISYRQELWALQKKNANPQAPAGWGDSAGDVPVVEGASHAGGTVPGMRGTSQLRRVQAGEEIVPLGSTGGGGGGITINVNGFVGSEIALAQAVANALTKYERLNGTRRSGIT